MYTIVDMFGDKVIWMCDKLFTNKDSAEFRKQHLQKYYPKKNLKVVPLEIKIAS